MKKVLFIVQLPPPIHGASMINKQVVENLKAKEEIETQVINLQFSKSTAEIERFSMRKVLRTGHFALAILKHVFLFKPDLVYFTPSPKGIAFYRDVFFIFLLKLFGQHIVLHLHGKGIRKTSEESFWKKRLYRWVFRNTQVICLSQLLTLDIAGVYDGKPFVVPNGIEPQAMMMKERNRERNCPLRIFYLSNFFTTKGILLLLEALKQLKQQGRVFEAQLAGAPGDISLDFLENRIDEAGIRDCVKVLGPVYGQEKYKALQEADLFVHPTYNDAFPLVILEAMQCGLPVVSTFEGGIPDMVNNGDTGFLVEVQNVQMLAEKIAALLENESLRLSMGKKAYARYLKNFTSEAFDKNIELVFRRLLKPHPQINWPVQEKTNQTISKRLN